MKAINFLEFVKLCFEKASKYHPQYDCDLVNREKGKIKDNGVHFYSQPFTPELIEKYFEGWECEREIQDGGVLVLFYFIDGLCTTFVNGNEESYCLETNAYLKHQATYPMTLDNFITDVIRENELLPFYFNQTAIKELNLNN